MPLFFRHKGETISIVCYNTLGDKNGTFAKGISTIKYCFKT